MSGLLHLLDRCLPRDPCTAVGVPSVSARQSRPPPPLPVAATRITSVIRQHPRWSVFWDKRYAVWRAAEDDPESDLYAESGDAQQVIDYIAAHSQEGNRA